MKTKIFKKVNLQLFAKDLKSTETATYGKKMNETEAQVYYEDTILDAMYEEYNAHQYFESKTLPKHHGKKLRWKRNMKYDAKINTLSEGVIPAEDEPTGTYVYEITLSTKGGYITFTDEYDLYSINGDSTRLAKEQGKSVGEKLNKDAYNILCSSSNRWFAGATTLTSLSAARASVSYFKLNEFRSIFAFLQRAKVKGYDGANYLVLISPEVAQQLFDLTKSGTEFTFTEIGLRMQKEDKVYDGVIGKWLNFTFKVDTMINEIADGVHGCLILGKYDGHKGATALTIEGEAGEKPSVILKPLSAGGARENPLNQIGSIGWKRIWGGAVTDPEAVLVYECKVDRTYGEFDRTFTEAFFGGYDKDGNSVSKTTKDVAVNSTFVTE